MNLVGSQSETRFGARYRYSDWEQVYYKGLELDANQSLKKVLSFNQPDSRERGWVVLTNEGLPHADVYLALKGIHTEESFQMNELSQHNRRGDQLDALFTMGSDEAVNSFVRQGITHLKALRSLVWPE